MYKEIVGKTVAGMLAGSLFGLALNGWFGMIIGAILGVFLVLLTD